jgi:hypothetical protein
MSLFFVSYPSYRGSFTGKALHMCMQIFYMWDRDFGCLLLLSFQGMVRAVVWPSEVDLRFAVSGRGVYGK